MRNVVLFDIFVSCPDFMKDQLGRIISTTRYFNSELRKIQKNFYFNIVHYDEEIASSFCSTSTIQEKISGAIGGYDIYLGMFGARFASTSQPFGGGTRYEFDEACALMKQRRCKHVSLLINPSLLSEPGDSRAALDEPTVASFKEFATENGVLPKDFLTADDLSNQYRLILNDFIETKVPDIGRDLVAELLEVMNPNS